MRIFLVLFLVVASLSAGADIIGRDQLQAGFRLEVEGGQPYIVVSFANRSSTPIPFFIPAGALLIGEAEPCLPVVFGRDVRVSIPPKGTQRVRLEGLSLSPYPHSPGSYHFAQPDDESRRTCKWVQAVLRRQRTSASGVPTLRLCQAVVFLSQNVESEQLARLFSAEELREAREIFQGGATPPSLPVPSGSSGGIIVTGTTRSGTRSAANCQGDPFLGGSWCNSRNGSDWLQRDFGGLYDVREISIGRAGSDVTTQASSIELLLQNPQGQWVLAEKLVNTNINWGQLTGGGPATSIASYRRLFHPPMRARAFRLVLTGHGWFTARDIVIHGDPAR